MVYEIQGEDRILNSVGMWRDTKAMTVIPLTKIHRRIV